MFKIKTSAKVRLSEQKNKQLFDFFKHEYLRTKFKGAIKQLKHQILFEYLQVSREFASISMRECVKHDERMRQTR